MPRVAVDLTPVLPGGENGGAKTATLALIASLPRIAPEWEFLLLTSHRSHDELAPLDAPGVRRLCVADAPARGSGVTRAARRALETLAPRPVLEQMVRGYRSLLGAAGRGLLAQLGADLLFSPFLSPLFYEAGVPSVVVVTDLQFRFYPQFFDRNERRHRQRSFRAACQCASRLVCISDYVKGTVIELGRVAPDRCVRIYLGARGRLAARPDAAVYQRWALTPGEYLLYPANFWPHKNHERLLAAFARYVQRVPRSRLKLMCCGAPGPHEHRVRQAAQSAGLDARAVFPGYVSDRELEALLAGAKALIFPSLYEGFGMPLLEAMEAGCPVLASATAGLPEIGGQAYFAFDPLDVEAIGDAIARIDSDPTLVTALIERGKERARLFGDAERMAHEYLAVFRDTLSVTAAVGESGLALRQIRL